LVKNTFSKGAPACSRIFCAARPRARFACAGLIVGSVAACSWIAATTLGCRWPMFVFTSCEEKSRYFRPS